MAIIFCTTDLTKWGVGVGRNLHDYEVDDNFWFVQSLITAVSDHLSSSVVSIASITLTPPNQLYVHLTDSTILGPFTLPTATWNLTNMPSGLWLPLNVYVPYDVFNINGTTYLVVIGHTSAATFDPNATDGMGHNLYAAIMTSPADVLPNGGQIGDVLTATSAGGAGPPTTAWQPSPGISTVVTRTDHTFVPALVDANTYNRMTNVDGCIVIVPDETTANFAIGTEMHFRQASPMSVLFEAASPAVINFVSGFLNGTDAEGATVTLKKVDADTWDIFGLLAVH